MQNLQQVDYKPDFAPKVANFDDSPETIETYNKVVDHALRKHLTPEEFEHVVNGYRRSQWSEEAFLYGLKKMDQPEHTVPKDAHYEKALKRTYEVFKPDELIRPVHFADLRHYPWPLSSNVGAPFNTSPKWRSYVTKKFEAYQNGTLQEFLDKNHPRDLFYEAHGSTLYPEMVDNRMSKRNLYNEMFYINRWKIHTIKDGHTTDKHGYDLRYWNTAFARQHIVTAEDPDKVRLVFGAPSVLLMAELMFMWPLQAMIMAKGNRSPMLWPFVIMLGGWYRILAYAGRYFPRIGTVLTLDWSGFDRDARHTVIRDIHQRILRPMFTFTSGYHPTTEYPDTSTDTDPTRLENLWKWMTDTILSVPLLLPDGRMFQFTHSGIFSGYFQTQILDSLYNCVMIYTILSSLGFDIDKIDLKVQGDDSLIFLLHPFIMLSYWIIQMIKNKANYYFRATLSDRKSEVREHLDHAEVLKYRNKGGMPYRPEMDLLAMLRHPERSRALGALLSRSVGIAYANCGAHPRVYLICEDIHHFLLKLDVKPIVSTGKTYAEFVQQQFPGLIDIDFQKFPTYFETVSHLTDEYAPQPTDKYWPSSHFIGIPGQA